MMGSVVRAIQELGVEVKFIPPGCTGLAQPINIGYNKSFKTQGQGTVLGVVDGPGS
jgi:hypothetical protein